MPSRDPLRRFGLAELERFLVAVDTHLKQSTEPQRHHRAAAVDSGARRWTDRCVGCSRLIALRLPALACVALGFLAAGCSERTFMPRARQLVAAAQAGDFGTAYRCTSTRFRERVPLTRFQAVLERDLDIRVATIRRLNFAGQTSNRAGKAEGELQNHRGVIPVTLALNRAVMDMDYLVDDIEAGGRSLFPELER